jgi:hypothetical protein
VPFLCHPLTSSFCKLELTLAKKKAPSVNTAPPKSKNRSGTRESDDIPTWARAAGLEGDGAVCTPSIVVVTQVCKWVKMQQNSI